MGEHSAVRPRCGCRQNYASVLTWRSKSAASNDPTEAAIKPSLLIVRCSNPAMRTRRRFELRAARLVESGDRRRSCVDDHQIPVRVGDLGKEARGYEPSEILIKSTRVIDLRVDVRNDVGGIDRPDDIGKNETPYRSKDSRDAPVKIRFALALKMVDCEGGHDQVERSGG